MGQPMTPAQFISQVRLASDVLSSGGQPPRLKTTPDVLTCLGLPPNVQSDFMAASVSHQVEMLTPFIRRYQAQQKQAKTQSAEMAANSLVRELQAGAQVTPEGIALPVRSLTVLSAAPVFPALQFIAGDTTWSFPRRELAQVLHSLDSCHGASVHLRGDRLVVSYTNATGGRGEFVLFDLGQRATYKGALTVNLAPQPAVTEAERPVQTPQSVAAPSRPQPPSRETSWLMDLVYGVADALMAG